MAGVSKSALQKVKSAMTSYSSDSQRILQGLCQQVNASVSQCSQQLNSMIQQKDGLQTIVLKQRQQVQSIHQQIETLASEIKKLQIAIPQLVKKIESLQQKISMLNHRLAVLQRQLSQAKDDEEKAQIEKQIEEVERELHVTVQEKCDSDRRLDESKRKLEDKQAQQTRLRSELSQVESSLVENEHKLRILTEKCDQLRSAFTTVRENADGLISASKRLQGSDTMKNNVSCIDSCIASLDEYLSVNF